MKTHELPGFELGAVVATGLLHVLFQGLGGKGLFVILASVSWVTYIGWRVWQNPGLWRQWGFRADNFKASLLWPTIAFILAMVGMAVFAMSFGRDLWNEHIIIPIIVRCKVFWNIILASCY